MKNKKIKYDIQEIEAFANQLSPEQQRLINETEIRQVKEEYACFLKAFTKDECYLCSTPLTETNPRKLCPHWLLQPNGIKGRDIGRVLVHFGYFRTQAFLRWVANQKGFAKNINDLVGEREPTKIMETTIIYRDFEWTFCFGQSDLDGHKTSDHAEIPHFHFQMKRCGHIVVSFNDLHCPFSDYDLFKIEIICKSSGKIKHGFTFGEGMDDLLSPEMTEAIIKKAKTPNSPDEAVVRLQSIVLAKRGTTISSDEITTIFKEAREKDVPVASLLHKLKDKIKCVTVISPSETIPEIAHRNKSRGKKKNV